MKKKQIIIAVIVLAFLLASVPVGVYLVKQSQEIRKEAAPATTLTLTAMPATVAQDGTFDLTIKISSNENYVGTMDATLNFSASVFEGIEITKGSFFDEEVIPAVISSGEVRLVYKNSQPKQGNNQVVALIKFNAAADAPLGSSSIGFDEAKTDIAGGSGVGGKSEGKVLLSTTPATITITSGEVVCEEEDGPCSEAADCCEGLGCSIVPPATTGTCQAVPTSTPTPTGTTTLTPTPTSGNSPTATPTPVPECWDTCDVDEDCLASLECQEIDGVDHCVNPDCPEETDCQCPGATATPTLASGLTATPTPIGELLETGEITPTLIFSLGGGFLLLLGFLALLL